MEDGIEARELQERNFYLSEEAWFYSVAGYDTVF